MKIKHSFLLAAITFAVFSCSKKDTTTVVIPPPPVSNPIAPGNITGFVKGTLTTGNTYTITGDLTVKLGDTLASQEGVTVIVTNNSQINILGVLSIVGTKDKPVSFNSDSKQPGSWGGFQCDSAQAVTIKWAHIDNTGGPDPAGDPRKTVFVNAPIKVDIEDCWFTNGQDDLIRMQNGAMISILRNTILSSGSTDGEAINLKTGVTGDVGYNVIYSQAGTGVKLETDDVMPFPQTIVNVYNNTLVSNGWRRGAAEPGRGVSVGLNAKGNIYNNIMVNDYQG
ncbi:MAG: right-handed parallel beta-helix repeat-containing protein, partial [Ginsengibacter sp.]